MQVIGCPGWAWNFTELDDQTWILLDFSTRFSPLPIENVSLFPASCNFTVKKGWCQKGQPAEFIASLRRLIELCAWKKDLENLQVTGYFGKKWQYSINGLYNGFSSGGSEVHLLKVCRPRKQKCNLVFGKLGWLSSWWSSKKFPPKIGSRNSVKSPFNSDLLLGPQTHFIKGFLSLKKMPITTGAAFHIFGYTRKLD